MTPRLNDFIRILVERSKANTAAILLLYEQELFGNCVSTLRQELDSLIRVCYLNALMETAEIDRLIEDTVNGVEWKINDKRITDKKMINIASQYNHWAPEVYQFGNCFTHLTNYHDYQHIDPLVNLDMKVKHTIKQYLNTYHAFPIINDVTFQNVIPYLPKVAEKISHNLQSYITDLKSRP